ncbi:MAG TPA: class I SAM-dependent methyltransferase [Methylomirabilota bacterium]|jgi:SAM-dependent methyltransferase|nr:class I SAM-dependent methyltransferase [Methylomirabilota bacterium]
MDSDLIARRWDAEYRAGRYAGDPPLRFVGEILSALDAHPALRRGLGLYVGCGNGRNYLPLVDAGLRLCGLDLSLESLRQLAGRRPATSLPLVCGEFRAFSSARPFGYVVALQVFQHGTAADVAAYVEHAWELLEPRGLLFLRINSAATQIYHAHTILERDALGGVTVRYGAGPKTGLPVHFCSRDELAALTRARFEPVGEVHEDVIARDAPKTGSWAQWQGIWRRR